MYYVGIFAVLFVRKKIYRYLLITAYLFNTFYILKIYFFSLIKMFEQNILNFVYFINIYITL